MTLAVDQPIINDPYQEPTRWWGSTEPERSREMRGTVSQPGEHQRIAVKVSDFRGNEVVRVVGLGAGKSE